MRPSLRFFIAWAAWPIGAVLLLFNLRRLLFLLAAAYDLARPSPATDYPSPFTDHEPPPTVLLLAPLRNEAASLPALLESLLALDYPRSRLTIGLVDDGSTDGTGAVLDQFAALYGHVEVLHHPFSQGKARALNAGLRRWPSAEIVAVYDADGRPAADSLRQIVAAFADPKVAGAGGLIRPANGLATWTATYSAIERLVHQQVTMRAKDRLRLAPALLGSHCAYRRSDLEAAGGFPGGALLEDSALTVAFARHGRLTRFLPGVTATDRVPETLQGYWRQHVRWGRGFYDVAGQSAELASSRLSGYQPENSFSGRSAPAVDSFSGPLRLELALFALGYLDRLALLGSLGLLMLDRLARAKSRVLRALAWLVGLNLLLPYAQIVLALVAERASPAWWLRLPLMPVFFVIDIAAAIWSAWLSLARRPRTWQPTER